MVLMMLSRAASLTLRSSRRLLRPNLTNVPSTARRQMGGGGHWMSVSKTHTMWGEAFGVVCWLWVFHRARYDLPVVLGWKHPWDHDDHGDFFTEHVTLDEKALKSNWDENLYDPGDVDDDDDDDDDDDEDDEEEDEDDEE